MSQTPHFAFPYLHPTQAGKELTHNEALLLIDALLHQRAEGIGADPVNLTAPQEGQMWVVAQNATGDWAGQDGALALRTQSQWRFITPVTGQILWLFSNNYWLRFDGSAWQLPPLSPAIAASASEDTGARAALSALISALNQWGFIRGS